jgi:hypothetical protein
MNTPCHNCLVKPVCKHYCDLWFSWLQTYSIVPLDMDIRLNVFLELVGNFGPIKNYYQNEYTISTIKFEKTANDNKLRVCLLDKTLCD